MRRLFDGGLKSVRQIAEQFDVHYNTAYKIVRRDRWKHIA
jgi:transposase